MTDFRIERNASLTGKQIEDLRETVGWDRMEGIYDSILARAYTHFSVMDEARLVAFVDVISEGVADALLVDLMIHPDYQGCGLGQALVAQAIQELKSDGIRAIQVIFEPRLEGFYRKCGFYILQAGIIDTWAEIRDETEQRIPPAPLGKGGKSSSPLPKGGERGDS